MDRKIRTFPGAPSVTALALLLLSITAAPALAQDTEKPLTIGVSFQFDRISANDASLNMKGFGFQGARRLHRVGEMDLSVLAQLSLGFHSETDEGIDFSDRQSLLGGGLMLSWKKPQFTFFVNGTAGLATLRQSASFDDQEFNFTDRGLFFRGGGGIQVPMNESLAFTAGAYLGSASYDYRHSMFGFYGGIDFFMMKKKS